MIFLIEFTCFTSEVFLIVLKLQVLLKYRNEYCNLIVKQSCLFLVDVKSPEGGELSLSVCLGLGNKMSSCQILGVAHGWGGEGGHGNS